MSKLYVLHLEWCENSDDGKEILMVTSDYAKVRHTYEREVNKLIEAHPDWTIMSNTLTCFYHHHVFPDHCELRILDYEDGEVVTNDGNISVEQKNRLCTFGRRLWLQLTPNEREAYYNDMGTIEFVERVATMLNLQLCTTTLSEFERIHNYIIQED